MKAEELRERVERASRRVRADYSEPPEVLEVLEALQSEFEFCAERARMLHLRFPHTLSQVWLGVIVESLSVVEATIKRETRARQKVSA